MSRDNFPAELRYNFSVEESHNALPSWWVLFFSVEGNFLGSFIDKLKTPVTITRLVILLERVQYSVTLSPQESSFFVQWIVSWSISDMHCMFYIFNQITKKSVLINFFKYLYLFIFFQAGGIFVRWGRKDCPGNNTELIYSGMADL